MGPLDALWHLLNFFAPAAALGLLSACFVKLAWRGQLKGVAWRRLAAWSGAGAALALVAGLVVLGRDGRMLTYLAMVLASALALAWVGWGPRSRG
ncbi:hypothetical protein OOT46_04690 [Aquabacterium sp. A7-Y]|uniref:hypothetical protein n=1 Tax=Aquabacterium sp. A7-Y TaxID=1349605 RepID=UPI00223E86E0|nr:hypothetical protein [Aquabacterium sp. A7-Y]MCW7537148.1 hypothetical protein [Aquabacterium sp. A7-Y]